MYRLITRSLILSRKSVTLSLLLIAESLVFFCYLQMALPDLIRLSGQKKTASKAAFFGGCVWDRTSDPYDVNVVLIPLSYTPVNERMFTIKNFINQEFYCIYSKKLCITSCNLPFAH